MVGRLQLLKIRLGPKENSLAPLHICLWQILVPYVKFWAGFLIFVWSELFLITIKWASCFYGKRERFGQIIPLIKSNCLTILLLTTVSNSFRELTSRLYSYTFVYIVYLKIFWFPVVKKLHDWKNNSDVDTGENPLKDENEQWY